MMDEMVERVARAIAEADNAMKWEWALPYARAAIAAMREPTEAMYEAGRRVLDDDMSTTDIWQAMIDSALGSKP